MLDDPCDLDKGSQPSTMLLPPPSPSSPRKPIRQCRACGQQCTKRDGPLVQALGDTYHYQCFVCQDCHKLVADKFYALDSKSEYQPAIIVCEQHYYSRLGLVCKQCHQPILGPVEPGLEYHPQCMRCPECVANEQQSEDGSCFEFHGQAYCRYHFSLIPDTRCAGCDQAILKQFVEHHSRPRKKWHPECYMIQKFWNIRLADMMSLRHDNPRSMTADRLRELQDIVETKAARIWTDLSAFQESSATCISDMLFHIAAGAYTESMRMASQFILHLEVLFAALDTIGSISAEKGEELQCAIETRSICSQIIRIFQLLAQDGNMDGPKSDTDVTQELLSLVTGMAQNLKCLIRIGLAQALRLETDHRIQDAVPLFLGILLPLENQRVWMAGRYWFKDDPSTAGPDNTNRHVTQCQRCRQPVDGDCIRKGILRWHLSCFTCSRCHCRLAKELDKACVSQSQSTIDLVCSHCGIDVKEEGCALQDDGPPFVLTSRWEQCLDLVKSALGQLYTSSSRIPDDTSRQTTLHDYETKINTAAPRTRRQSSLLRLMNRSTTRRQSLFGSVHLTHVKRTDTSTTPSCTPTTSSPTWRWRNPARQDGQQQQQPSMLKRAITIREAAATASTANNNNNNRGGGSSTLGRFGSIRRALSTNRRERRPLHGVFDRYNKKTHSINVLDRPPQQQQQSQQAQQASICTFDTFDATATLNSSSVPPPPPPPPPFDGSSRAADCGEGATTTETTTTCQHHSGDLSAIQDAVLRYMAALYIESLVRGSFSLEELVALTETKRATASLWYKLKTHIRVVGGGAQKHRRYPHHAAAAAALVSSNHHSNKTFGVSLVAIAKRDLRHHHHPAPAFQDMLSAGTHPLAPYYFSSQALVPTFVKNCILGLYRMDMSLEGVFRKNGNVRELNEICSTVNRDATCLVYLEESPIQLAALLKRFLRDLPEPLLTFKLYDLLISSIRIHDESKSKMVLHLACCMMPKANRDTMQILFLFLKWVATFHETNKMDVTNLARVIAPTVFYSSAATKELTVERQQSARDEIKVVELLIRYQDEFCMVPQALVGIVQDPRASDYLGDPKQALEFLDLHYHHLITDSSLVNDENIAQHTSPSPSPPVPMTTSRSTTPHTLRRSWIPRRD